MAELEGGGERVMCQSEGGRAVIRERAHLAREAPRDAGGIALALVLGRCLALSVALPLGQCGLWIDVACNVRVRGAGI